MLIKYVTTGSCYKSIGTVGHIIRSKMEKSTACTTESWHSKPSHYRVSSAIGKGGAFVARGGGGQRWTIAICIQNSSRTQRPQASRHFTHTIGFLHYPKIVKSIATEGIQLSQQHLYRSILQLYQLSKKHFPSPPPPQKKKSIPEYV